MLGTMPEPRRRLASDLLLYTVLLGVAIGAYLWVRHAGMDLVAAAPLGNGPGRAASSAGTILQVLIALVVVITTARVVGTLFRWLSQPPVIGEMVAGILLGPSLLGRLAPDVSAALFPVSVTPVLGILAQVGVILYMFLVGLELDTELLGRRGRSTVAISHASIVVPFLLGALLALELYPRLSSSDVPFTNFSLFLGVSMSVTAFPVLARILTDRRIHKTRVGVIALTCAAVDDVTAWCLLAIVVGVVKSQPATALLTAGLALAFIAAMIFIGRPLMQRLVVLYGARGKQTRSVMAIVFVALLLSALSTEAIGIHAVFGAFLLGAILPHDSTLARDLSERLEDLVVVLFLPAFFAFTGLRTQIGLVAGSEQWLLCGVILLTATVGKFGGSFVAALATGLPMRDSAALGILMNTRGLMELIVLNIGLELGVISPTLFAMLVIMAVVTTFMTTPIVALFMGRRATDEPDVPEEETAPVAVAAAARQGVLVPVANPSGMEPLVDLALAATGPGEPPVRVVTLVHRSVEGVGSGHREDDDPPRADILVQAMAHARERGARLDAEAHWTDHESTDIVGLAERAHVKWLLLGFHRPVFGRDTRGGVVRDIMETRQDRGCHVAVVVHRHDRPLKKLAAMIDDSDDGRAALELALRLAHGKDARLQLLVIPREGHDSEPALTQLLKDSARKDGRWVNTEVLTGPELRVKGTVDAVLIGEALADRLGLPLEGDEDDGRCVIVVQAGRAPAAA
jgi:Kef-type K+ transport system membrane component KefB